MATKSVQKGKSSAASGRWHAISVKPGSGACPAATAAKNQRWLSREAPHLPLPGCTRADSCKCVYKHHEDRRDEGRRAEDTGAFPRPRTELADRRGHRDRRAPSDE